MGNKIGVSYFKVMYYYYKNIKKNNNYFNRCINNGKEILNF